MIKKLQQSWWFYPAAVLSTLSAVGVIIGVLYGRNIFYEIINFGLIAAIVTYLFTEYILPFARSEIAVEKAETAQLERQESSLSSQVQSLSHDAVRLVQYNMRLEKKMAAWVCAAEKQLARVQRQADRAEQVLQERAVAQMEQRVRAQVQHQVLCNAAEQARHALQKKYAHIATGQEYLASLCDLLERESA